MRKPRAKPMPSPAYGKTMLIVFAAAALSAALWGSHTPFQSAEVHFADTSSSGLSIMPASCDSSPHWSGECASHTACSITASPSSYASGQVSTISLTWQAPQPPPSTYDSQINSTEYTISGLGNVFYTGSVTVAAPTASYIYWLTTTYKNSAGTILGYGPSCSATANVSNTPSNQSLYFNQVELYRPANAAVVPGDYITYRFYFNNTGNVAESNVKVTVPIPANTTLVSQGGGTDAGSGQLPNCQGDGRLCLYWIESSIPPGSSGYYVDYRVQVNSNAPNGTLIESVGTISDNPATVTPFNSNAIDNTVAFCTTALGGAPNTSNAYALGAYSATGRQANINTTPICVSNYGPNSYFIPANSTNEMDSFKAHVPPGASVNSI